MTLYWGASYDLPSHFQSLSHWPAISLASEKASHHNLSPAHFTHESIPSSIYECLWAFPGSLWSRSQKYSQQFSCHTNTFVWPIIKPPIEEWWWNSSNDQSCKPFFSPQNLFLKLVVSSDDDLHLFEQIFYFRTGDAFNLLYVKIMWGTSSNITLISQGCIVLTKDTYLEKGKTLNAQCTFRTLSLLFRLSLKMCHFCRKALKYSVFPMQI